MAGTLTTGTGSDTRPGGRPSVVAVTVSTTTVLPLFLTAGLAVQIGADLGFTASALGVAPAAFFGAGALLSPFAGVVVGRVGTVRAMRLAVLSVSLLMVAVAVTARSLAVLVGLLAVAGAVNALTQPATNAFVAQTFDVGRRGAAYGAKYAAIPTASLLAGLAVPLLGLTIGWRWAFALLAVAGVAVAWSTPRSRPDHGCRPEQAAPVRRLPRGRLLVLATGAGLAAAGGSALAVFMVAGGVDAGLGEGAAGLLFAAASGVGVAARLLSGVFADRRGRRHLEVVAAMLVVGCVGVVTLAAEDPTLFVLGAPLAFAAGWGWPGLFILAVVQIHPSAPAVATGITQTGTSVGCVVGPLVFGVLADRLSYGTAWLATGATLLLAAAVLVSARRPRSPGVSRTHEKGSPMSHRELVDSYFAACTRGDAAAIAGHFHADAVVYDTNHRPVRGADEIGAFFVRTRAHWGGASWEVNTFVSDTDVAAVEWTMRGHADGEAFAVRGSEHYELRDGRIAEIRQYWVFDRDHMGTGLRDYPYQSQERFAGTAQRTP